MEVNNELKSGKTQVSNQLKRGKYTDDGASKYNTYGGTFETVLTASKKKQNHSTQDSRVVPHRGTNWAALRLTSQIGRDAVLSESYGRG